MQCPTRVRCGSRNVPSSWSAKCRERTLRFALPQEICCSALIYSLFRLAGNSTANPLQRAIGTLSAKFLVFSGISGNWGRRDFFAEASQHSHLIAVSRSLQTPCSKCPEEARNCAIKWPWLSGGRFREPSGSASRQDLAVSCTIDVGLMMAPRITSRFSRPA